MFKSTDLKTLILQVRHWQTPCEWDRNPLTMSLAVSTGLSCHPIPTMSVRVHLDNPHAFYTNLDFLSGKIILNLMSDETISAIVVKLEGESRTLLVRPPEAQVGRRAARRDDRNQIASESHKILYKIQTVFPSITGSGPTSGASFTLRAGQHEYPFRFKIPYGYHGLLMSLKWLMC